MAPKARKSIVSWQSCEKCHSIISSKDVEVHNIECEIPITKKTHTFISNQKLYGYPEEIIESDVPDVIKTFKNELVILPQSAMQLCNFVIGDPVVLNFQQFKEVRKAWPKSEGSLTAIRISNPGTRNWNEKIFTQQVCISRVENLSVPAKSVLFKILEPEEPLQLDALLLCLKFKFKNRIFFPGALIRLAFYGKKVEIELLEFKCEVNKSLIEEMKNLCLNDTPFLLHENTKWIQISVNKAGKGDSNKIHLQDIGGYQGIINEIKESMTVTLEGYNMSDKQKCYGILLYGCHGCGKSMIAEALANDSSFPVIKVPGLSLAGQATADAVKQLNRSFEEAIAKTPCILLLDSLDVIAPAEETKAEHRIMSAALLAGFDSIQNYPVVILSTATSPDNINVQIRRPGRIENEIEIEVPSMKERKEILSVYFRGEELSKEVEIASEVTHGYVGADLAAVWSQARNRAISQQRPVQPVDLTWATSRVTPSAMRQHLLQVPQVKWSEVGGQEELKHRLRQVVEWPLKHPESFTRLGITPPKGLLMFGPPGCSKTMIAKALATETSLNFLSVKGSDIFSKWVGESERSVRDLFLRARRVAPCILFLDEVDALGASRDTSGTTSGSAVQERVLSQLLTELDGIQPLSSVVIIAATNRPDKIDKALLRPGRLDRLIYVPLPDLETRIKILKVHLKKTPISEDVDLNIIADITEGYSGAEVVAVCNEAALKALEEDMTSKEVSMRHFEAAMCAVTPRTPQSLLKIYEEYVNKFNFR